MLGNRDLGVVSAGELGTAAAADMFIDIDTPRVSKYLWSMDLHQGIQRLIACSCSPKEDWLRGSTIHNQSRFQQ